jgi:Predicted hydrolases or acyltransferases (alpha/beta hydrolase superfamily)
MSPVSKIKRNILLGFVLLLTLSMSLNHILLKAEDKRYDPPGKLIEIDRHKMHIYRTGMGHPTIVMTCGSGTPSAYTDFSIIQQKITGITRTCIYERPGYGWSEPASIPRDTEQIVSDLHRLLEKAGEKPPYIIVAHSMGAMEALLYTYKYPEEVAGIVLISGTSPYKHMYYSEFNSPGWRVCFKNTK